VPIPPDTEVAALAQDFNQMASRLRQLMHTVETERQRLDMVLATMADGIVIVNRAQEITLINLAGSALLSGGDAPVRTSIGNPEINLFQEALQSVWRMPFGETLVTIDDLVIAATDTSLRAQVTRLPAPEGDQTLIVLQDLTDLRRAERSRRVLMMSNIAHDLRTPLASLQAIVETLQDGALTDADAAPDFLRRMADEVLGLLRIESGELALDLALCDVAAIARSAAARMAEQAARAGLWPMIFRQICRGFCWMRCGSNRRS